MQGQKTQNFYGIIDLNLCKSLFVRSRNATNA